MYSSGTGPAVMIGVPSGSEIQPGPTSAPSRLAIAILFAATALIEASKTKGTSLRVGTATAIGFRPRRGSAPQVGTT